MSKVICDVCGTSFPETATHCPICGCAKAPTAQAVSADEAQIPQERSTSNTYAKGGRFAKDNVKRNSRSRSSTGRFSGERNRKNEPQESNKGLIAVVIVLLLAIVMVVVYIGVNVFFTDPGGNSDKGDNQSTGSYQQGGDSDIGQSVPCTAVKLNSKMVELKSENEQYLLAVQKEPENTTDTVTYTSSDPAIVTVDENGLIVPVGYGQATITVTCGTVSEECTVVSTVGEPPVSSVPESQGPALPDGFVLKLITYKDSGEITIAGDATSVLYKETMGIKASDITWTTSDPSIATVEDGKVTGVGKGYCNITATIGDQTATCKVICSSNAAPPSDYKLSHVDVTISVGETFNLSLKNKESGATVQGIEWQVSQEGIVSIDGNKITGQSVAWSGVNVFVEYEGVKYSCRIIVKPAAE